MNAATMIPIRNDFEAESHRADIQFISQRIFLGQYVTVDEASKLAELRTQLRDGLSIWDIKQKLAS